MCEGSKSKEVTSEDIKKLSIKKITSSNLFFCAGCFFFEMGRDLRKTAFRWSFLIALKSYTLYR